MNQMTIYLYMFDSFMKDWIVDYEYGTLVVTIDGD